MFAAWVNFIYLSAMNFSSGIMLQIETVQTQELVLPPGLLEETIKLLISIIAGFATTLLISFIKCRYPKLFTSPQKVESK